MPHTSVCNKETVAHTSFFLCPVPRHALQFLVANWISAVIHLHAMIQPDQLHPFPSQRPADVPASAGDMEFPVRIQFAHTSAPGKLPSLEGRSPRVKPRNPKFPYLPHSKTRNSRKTLQRNFALNPIVL